MRRAQRGFGLLELLVALGLVAATLAVAFRIMGGATRGAVDADRYTRAVLLAESRMAELGVSEALQTGEYYGDGGDGFLWRVAVRPMAGYQAPAPGQTLANPAAAIMPLVVSVSVVWGPEERPWEVTLTTLRLAPRPR